ncbi:MAG: hypothetical protein AAFN10_27270, partial [Bacteroidota bacterium]
AKMQKLAAEDLVTQMKREMGIEIPEKPAAESPEAKADATPKAEEKKPEEPKPKKSNKKSMGDF